MPASFSDLLGFIAHYRIWFIAGAVVLLFLITAIVTLVVAFRRLPVSFPLQSHAEPQPTPVAAEIAEPKVQRFRLAVGDVASPWTQGVYERNSPEGKLAGLLVAFALDEHGAIRRAQRVELVAELNLEDLVRQCASAGGMAIHGAYATLALWHAGDSRYAAMALKVVSHAQVAEEQKDLIRFLFQDIVGHPVKPHELPGLVNWQNREFRTALALYTATRIREAEWQRMAEILPQSLHRFYELELAQKLPPRTIYHRAKESRVYAEGLFRLNLTTLARYMNPRRWQRLQNSDKAERFAAWVKDLPCQTETQALLHLANPEIFDVADLESALAEKIQTILEAKNPRAWLFEGEKPPRLQHRLLYFKYFCLFGKFHEAVRCFSMLGIFRRDRAQRLWYARVLFFSGMQHEAWAEMSALLVDYPRDAAVLNEAGIYAHKLGRYEEAQQIFALARSYYPEDATIAYNEAVFTEQYSRKQIEEKWSQVQRLTAPPVLEA